MKMRFLAAALAAFFMLPFFGVTAYAGGDDPEQATAIMAEVPEAPVTDYPKTPPNPLTPSGTATVIDYATDEDGKLFYTIMTPDEHVFYLVIDRQRSAENVYFLNAVTIADLAALAEIPIPAQGGLITPPPTVTDGTELPGETPPRLEDEPRQDSGGNMGMYIFIIVIAVLGGGAGWYFKIYRPKQQGAADADEYDPAMEDTDNDYADDWGDDSDEADNSPTWDEDGESGDEDDV